MTQEPEVKLPPVVYSIADATLAEKRAGHAHLLEIEVTDNESYGLVKAAAIEWKKLRTGLDKERLKKTETAREYQGRVNGEAKRIQLIIANTEDPLKAKREAWEERIEREREAAAEAERIRINGIMERIEEIKRVPQQVTALTSSDDIMRLGARVSEMKISIVEFAEFQDSAVGAKDGALRALKAMYDAAKIREDEAERLAEQKRVQEVNRKEQEKAAKELADRERKVAEREAAAAPAPDPEPEPEPVPAEEVPDVHDVRAETGYAPHGATAGDGPAPDPVVHAANEALLDFMPKLAGGMLNIESLTQFTADGDDQRARLVLGIAGREETFAVIVIAANEPEGALAIAMPSTAPTMRVAPLTVENVLINIIGQLCAMLDRVGDAAVEEEG